MIAITRISEYCEIIAKQALWVVIAVMLVMTTVQVFSRYVLNSGFFWAEELVRYLFVWASFLGASIAIKRKTHLAFTLMIETSMPGIMGKIMSAGRDIIILVALFILVYYGTRLTYINWTDRSIALGISMALPYSIIPIASIMMIIHHISNFLNEGYIWK